MKSFELQDDIFGMTLIFKKEQVSFRNAFELLQQQKITRKKTRIDVTDREKR